MVIFKLNKFLLCHYSKVIILPLLIISVTDQLCL